MSLLFLIVLGQSSSATILDQLETAGVSRYQPAEMAMILAGVDESELPAKMADFENLIQALVDSVDSSKPIKKMAKQLHAELFKQLKSHDENSYKLTELLGSKTYSTITAAFLFYEVAQRLGMEVQLVETPIHVFGIVKVDKKDIFIEFFDKTGYDKRYTEYQAFARDLLNAGVTDEQALANILIQDKFEEIRSKRRGIAARDLVAIMAAKAGVKRITNGDYSGVADVNLASELAAASWFGWGNYDRELHMAINQLYQAKNIESGLNVSACAARRFPDYRDYEPFLFNFAVLRIEQLDKAKDYSAAFDLANRVQGLLSAETKGQFREVFPTLHHNYAVSLFNLKSFKDSAHHGELALTGYQELVAKYQKLADGAAKADDFNKSVDAINELIPKAKSNWIDQLLKEGDQVMANQVLQDLSKTYPSYADQIKTRMDQQALESLYNSGNYEDALAIALKRIDDENGPQNYLATVNRYASSLIENGRFDEALKALDQVHPSAKDHQVVKDLRYNCYIAMLTKLKDAASEKQLVVYARLFADHQLVMTDEEREGLTTNHVAVFAQQVEKDIADGKYSKASDHLAVGEKIYPSNTVLLNLRKKIRLIQERLADQ